MPTDPDSLLAVRLVIFQSSMPDVALLAEPQRRTAALPSAILMPYQDAKACAVQAFENSMEISFPENIPLYQVGLWDNPELKLGKQRLLVAGFWMELPFLINMGKRSSLKWITADHIHIPSLDGEPNPDRNKYQFLRPEDAEIFDVCYEDWLVTPGVTTLIGPS